MLYCPMLYDYMYAYAWAGSCRYAFLPPSLPVEKLYSKVVARDLMLAMWYFGHSVCSMGISGS